MKSMGRLIGSVALILAVMGYTIYNYMTGRTDFSMFLVSMAVLCLPLFNMVRILFQEWKDSH